MKKILYLLVITFISFKAVAQDKKHDLILNNDAISFGSSKIEINNDGFPKQIYSADQLLYEPIHFHYFTSSKTQDKLVSDSLLIYSSTSKNIAWSSTSHSDHVKQEVVGKMLANGLITFKVKLVFLKDVTFSNIAFHIPFIKSTAKYLYGLDQKDYLRPDTVRWQWANLPKIKPKVWIGNTNSGLYLSLKTQQNNLISAIENGWAKNKNGKLQINVKGSSMLYEYSTGNIELKTGNALQFDFNLIIDPSFTIKTPPDILKYYKSFQKLDLKEK